MAAAIGIEFPGEADAEDRSHRDMRRADRQAHGGGDDDGDGRRQGDAERPDAVQLGNLLADHADQLGTEQRQPYGDAGGADQHDPRSEEHTSELQSLMRNSYAVFSLNTK